jgi:hypothetical protein
MTNHVKSIVGTVPCVSVTQTPHFLQDWKKNVLEYKVDLKGKGASKTIPSRYWKTRWMWMISAAWILSMLIQNSHELWFFSSTLITDGGVFRFTHTYQKTEFLVGKCCILLLYWFVGSKFALCCLRTWLYVRSDTLEWKELLEPNNGRLRMEW